MTDCPKTKARDIAEENLFGRESDPLSTVTVYTVCIKRPSKENNLNYFFWVKAIGMYHCTLILTCTCCFGATHCGMSC